MCSSKCSKAIFYVWENTISYRYIKCSKFWRVSLDQFVECKHLILEECWARRRFSKKIVVVNFPKQLIDYFFRTKKGCLIIVLIFSCSLIFLPEWRTFTRLGGLWSICPYHWSLAIQYFPRWHYSISFERTRGICSL